MYCAACCRACDKELAARPGHSQVMAMSEPISRRVVLFGLALPFAGTTAARAQDNGSYYLEQVRRNQQFGTPGLPTAAQPPLTRGPGALYNDSTQLRQRGELGPR